MLFLWFGAFFTNTSLLFIAFIYQIFSALIENMRFNWQKYCLIFISNYHWAICRSEKMIFYLFSKCDFCEKIHNCVQKALPSFTLRTSFGVVFQFSDILWLAWKDLSLTNWHFSSIIFCIDMLTMQVFYQWLYNLYSSKWPLPFLLWFQMFVRYSILWITVFYGDVIHCYM